MLSRHRSLVTLTVSFLAILALVAVLASNVSANGGVDEGLAPAALTDGNGLPYPNLGSHLSGLAA